MNELPEQDDDLSVRRLLAESGTEESPELLEGLRRLRSFRAAPAPEPTGELAALLAETPARRRQRPKRHRGLILSFALAGAMAAGTTGVAANNDLRLATDSFCADLIEQVLPAQDDGGEPQPPAEMPDDLPVAAGDAAAETGAGDAGGEPAASGSDMPEPAVEGGGYETAAAAETLPPADNALSAPNVEPEPALIPEAPVIPEAGAQEPVNPEKPGTSGGEHPSGVRPGQGRAADGDGHPGRGRHVPGEPGPSGGPGPDNRGSSGHPEHGKGAGGPAGHSRNSAPALPAQP